MSKEKISRRMFIGSVAGAAAASAVVGGLAGWQLAPAKIIEKEVTPEPIKIGSAHPLTGWDAASGREMHRGTEMALEEIEELGGLLGRDIEWIELDSGEMSPEATISVMEALCTLHNVDWILYGYSYTYYSVYEKMALYNKPWMTYDTVKEFSDWVIDHPNKAHLAWQCCPIEPYYGTGFAVLLDKLIEEGKWTPINNKIALMRGEDAYGQLIAQTFKEEMEQRGWTTTEDETVTFGTVEFGPFLEKIRANPPAVIYNTDWSPSDLANFVLQFVENPTKSLIYGQWAPSVPEFLELTGEDGNGLIWSTVAGPLYGDPVTDAWYAKYKAKYNEEPGMQGALMYDMIWLWATAVALAGTVEAEAVSKVFERIIYRGACGTLKFAGATDERGAHSVLPYPDIVDDPSLGMAHHMIQVQNQEHVLFSPSPYEQGEFQLPPWI